MRLTSSVIALVLFLGLVSITPLTGCGAATHEKGIATGFVALNSLRDGFLAWDLAHQQKLAETPNVDEAKAKIAAYRAARDTILDAFSATYDAFSLATFTGTDTSYSDALKRGKALLDDITKLKGDAK